MWRPGSELCVGRMLWGVHASSGVHARLPSLSLTQPLRSGRCPDSDLHMGLLRGPHPADESFSVRTQVPTIRRASGRLLSTTSSPASSAAGVLVLGGAGGRWEKRID